MIYTLTMNPSLDYRMVLKTLTPGALNRSEYEYHICGGKGINVAVVLNNLGIPAVCLGFTAGFVGEFLKKELDGMGCGHAFTELEGQCNRINVKILEMNGQESEINAAGPKLSEADLETLKTQLQKLQSGDTLVLSGNVPGGVGKEIYGTIAESLQGKDVCLVVDAEKELLFPTLQSKPFLIKPNNLELEEMAGQKLKSREDTVCAAYRLQEMGARNILVSCGKEGACFVSETKEAIWIKAPLGTVINPVGSGDSMVAGFISGCIQGKSKKDAAKWAVACGSANAFSRTLPKKEEIETIYRRIAEPETVMLI